MSVNGKPAVSKTATEGSIPSTPAIFFIMNKIKTFLKEVYSELKKVTWLSRKDVVRSTISVGVVVMLVSIYIGLVDLGLTELMKLILGGR